MAWGDQLVVRSSDVSALRVAKGSPKRPLRTSSSFDQKSSTTCQASVGLQQLQWETPSPDTSISLDDDTSSSTLEEQQHDALDDATQHSSLTEYKEREMQLLSQLRDLHNELSHVQKSVSQKSKAKAVVRNQQSTSSSKQEGSNDNTTPQKTKKKNRRALLKREKSFVFHKSSYPMELLELLQRRNMTKQSSSLRSCIAPEDRPPLPKKSVRFATNSYNDKVWGLVKTIPQTNRLLQKILFWSDDELDHLFGQDTSIASTVERDFVRALRTHYDNITLQATSMKGMELCCETMEHHPEARGLESHAFPHIRPFCLRHRQAVLQAQTDLRMAGLSLFNDMALEYIRAESIKLSKPKREFAQKLAQVDQRDANQQQQQQQPDPAAANSKSRKTSRRRKALQKSQSWSSSMPNKNNKTNKSKNDSSSSSVHITEHLGRRKLRKAQSWSSKDRQQHLVSTPKRKMKAVAAANHDIKTATSETDLPVFHDSWKSL